MGNQQDNTSYVYVRWVILNDYPEREYIQANGKANIDIISL